MTINRLFSKSRRVAGLGFVAAVVQAAIPITGWEATSNRIVVRYTAPDESACTVQASRTNDFGGAYSPVPDVDTALFPGSDQDARETRLLKGKARTFVLGKDEAARAADGYVYSRALKTATTHYIKITCGTDSSVVAATTKTVPFGLTRGEAYQADPNRPGEYLHPSRKWTQTAQKIVDPLTGVELTFPVAIGAGASARTATFKEAVSSSWTTPASALTNDTASASIAADNTGTLFLQWDYDQFALAAGIGAGAFDAGGLDYFILNIFGTATGEGPAERTIEAALTFDGVNAAGDWRDVELPIDASEAAVTIGNGPGDTWQQAGRAPYGLNRFTRGKGTMTYVSATKVVKLTSGGASPAWSAGTRFRIYDPVHPAPVMDSTDASPIVVTLADHGFNTGDSVTIQGVSGNTAANGTWSITVVDADHFALDGATGNGPHGRAMALWQIASFGSPCVVVFDANQGHIRAGDLIKITAAPGVAGLVSDTAYAVSSVAADPTYGIDVTLEGSTCDGASFATASGMAMKMNTGTAQKSSVYPIASVDSGTQVTLANGPDSDITTDRDWVVEPFGVLIRKKTASADAVSVQYATMSYQTSAGAAWGAGGGPVCQPAVVPGPDGKPGKICSFGTSFVWVADDGTAVNDFGDISNYDEVAWGQYGGCVARSPYGSFGKIGLNPDYPKRVYCMPLGASSDHKFVVADYEGDFREAPQHARDHYYPGYSGNPNGLAHVLPNCQGYGVHDSNAGNLGSIGGEPCVKYRLVTSSMKGLIENFGRQLWRKMVTEIDQLSCVADYSAGWKYNTTSGKMNPSMTCVGNQDQAGINYIFEYDDGTNTLTPIAEVASWDRDGATWSGIHGGIGPAAAADNVVSTTPYPMFGCGQCAAAVLDSDAYMAGPFYTDYTAVDGVADAYATSTLQSCAAWAGSPYLPIPTPDGVTTMIGGHITGCTTLVLAGEPCKHVMGAMEQSIYDLDPEMHQAKCGGTWRWLQDLRLGDMIAFLPKPMAPYYTWEFGQVIAKTGSGVGTEITMYRGGPLPLAWSTYGFDRGARTYNVENSDKVIMAMMGYDPNIALYPANFYDYANHPSDQGGLKRMNFSPGHGMIARSATVGADPGTGDYGVAEGSFDERLYKPSFDYTITLMPTFAGKAVGNNLAIDTHITYIDQAEKPLTMLDGRPWNGHDGISGALVAGTIAFYKWPQAAWNGNGLSRLYRKHLPVAARASAKLCRNISSAATGDMITDATPYTFCLAHRAGECRADASAGDLYIAAPLVTTTGSVAQCCGNDVTNRVDLSFTSVSSSVSAYTETILRSDRTGRASRTLTTGLDRYRWENSFKNWSMTIDRLSGIGYTRALEESRSAFWRAEMPPRVVDSWDRTKYIDWPIKVPFRIGADNAVIEFGYSRYGNPEAGQFYCMDRAENCVAGANATANDPFWFAGDNYAGVPCGRGCTVHVPLVGNKVLYYRIKWRLGAAVAATSETRVLVTP